jgi:hypothetical protein
LEFGIRVGFEFRVPNRELFFVRFFPPADSVYQRVSDRAAEFLSPEELKQFNEFREYRIKENRMILTMNRKMMAPLGRK